MCLSVGAVVAGPDVPPHHWVSAFAPARGALVLEPGSAWGWFGGRSVVGCDPRIIRVPARALAAYRSSPGLERAAGLLEAALASTGPAMCAAVLAYDGAARIGVFPRGLELTSEGWRPWGDWSDSEVPPPVRREPLPAGCGLTSGPRRWDVDRTGFCMSVEAAKASMREGDLYVVNLCRRLEARPAHGRGVTCATLLGRTAASMGACWSTPGHTLISMSPERFIRLDRGLLVVEPVKGTRPRSDDARADAALMADLAASLKERAEHVMVVDLERNDIGRVCEPGSVVASPLMRLESTPYCHQLASAVGGLLVEGTPLAAVLAAAFPCGSVTGAPKPSAMEHIRRLERSCRGEYTGALVVALPGRLDSSVLIRTAVVENAVLSYGAGAGITVDSDPLAEWRETETKASPLFGGLPPS